MRTILIKLSDGHYQIAGDNEKRVKEWQTHNEISNALWAKFLSLPQNSAEREQTAKDYLAESKSYWGQ